MYRNNKSVTAYNTYKEIRNRINNRIKMIKTEYWEKYSSDIQHDLYGAQKMIWKLLRNRRKPVNETVRLSYISEEEWRTHFGNLYSIERTDNNKQ